MNGLATPIKGSNMGRSANQYKARTNFLLEHLASFTMKTSQEAQIPAKERLVETKEMLAKGSLWTKEMEMRLTDNDIVLLDGETQDVIEVYPLSSISVVQHIEEDADLNSVLLFTTQQTDEKYAATHLFQSDRVPAGVVATEIMKASSSKGAMPTFSRSIQSNKGGSSLPPPPSYTAPQPPTLDRERMDLYERALVAQTIAAFSVVPEASVRRRGKGSKDGDDDAVSVEVLEARTNRDVQILNHCIDDIESLVQQTKKSAEAWKKLQKKKGKIKPDNPLAIEARPPPESDFIDAFQKFKHAFNLLGKLRPYLHHPNAAELVHYLFVPLSLLVRCTNGPEKARGVLSPLLTSQAIELLQNCLSSKEMELWSALGPNWTETKLSKPFKDMFIPPYAPVFKDGWVPPEYIGGKDIANISAAVAANAAAVAQMNDQKKNPEDPTSPTVLAAAAKFRRLTGVKREAETSPVSKKAVFKRGIIAYEFNARNTKELTVKPGEEVSVLDDSRQWWCVRNTSGEIGFVPNTIVEVKGQENQSTVAATLPSPPSVAPPPIPNSAIISNVQLKKVENTETTTSITREEERKVPFVELRHVPVNKKTEEEVGPKPPPPPPMSPPPPSPPPVSSSSESTLIIQKTTRVVSADEQANALEKAVLSGGNLRKVDKEAVQKNREENQAKRMSSADLLNDELKRRMTAASALTPRGVRKTEHEEVVMLTPDSGTTEVRDWLKSKNFSQTCVQALAWKTAKDLEKMSKEDFKKKCGDAEGARVYSQFAVQKSKWETSSKGNELQFIMKKRKEIVEVKSTEQPSEEVHLRNIVAEARAVTDNDVTDTKTQETKRYSYSGMKPVMVTAPQERQRPQSMILDNQKVPPPVRPRSSSQNKAPVKSRGNSFVNNSFEPPPPVDYHEENEKSILTSDQVEAIIAEQKKQQELLMEHEKQFSLLERLQIQKLELQDQKKEYEELQKRQRQAELEEKQKELERQIKAQQEELKANSTRLEQQNQLLSNSIPGLNMTNMMISPRPAQFPVMSPQVQMVPVSGLSSHSAYLPMQTTPLAPGLQPLMGYAPVAQANVPQMVTPVSPYTVPQ